jgi:branched-chain amino acid transport system substrate-binding protein
MRQAAELAVREINARGGVRGRLLTLRVEDDSATPDVALRIARTLYDDPAVVAVIGHLNSSSTISAAAIYGGGSRPVSMITPSASSPDVSGLGPYVFRACPSDLAHGRELARYAWRQLGARRAAVIYLNDEYGRGVRQTFTREFIRLGGTVMAESPYLSATPSLEPYLAALRQRGGVDVLMLATDRPGAQLALREMAGLGVQWPVIGGDALTGIEGLGPLAEGVHVSEAYLPDKPGQRNATFVSAYARAFGGQAPDHRGASAYDIVYMLARAIDAAGSSRRAVRDYLARVGHGLPPFEGVTGTIAFDTAGDVPDLGVVIGAVRGGHILTELAPGSEGGGR